MSAPVLWILLPAFVSIFLFLNNKTPYRFLIFVLFSLFLAISTFFIRIDPAGDIAFFQISIRSDLNVLGRSFILTQNDLFLVRLIYFFNTIWGTCANFYPRQNRVIPLGLLFSAMLLGAFAVFPFLYAALIIALSIILSVPLLVGNSTRNLTGISRFVIYQILALPFILLAGWFLAGGEISPVNPSQLIQAALLLGLGFVLWLGVFPFHSWIPMLHREADGLNVGYILILLISITFLVILKFVDGFSWLRQYALFYEAMLLLGIIMETLGAVGVFFQKDLKEITGYAFLHMIGMLLVSVGIFPLSGIHIFPMMLAEFFIAVSLLYLVMEYLKNDDSEADMRISRSTDWNAIAVIGFVFALLSISGMPLTTGFPPVQWIYQLLARTNGAFFITLIFSKVLIAISAMRILKIVYQQSPQLGQLIPRTGRDWFMVIVFVIIVLSGIFPQFIYSNFDQLVTGFQNLIQ
jgi:formate hydrogenlyase subunit 3/multisubunit Na+/H+ antiporter MnhD subunit